MIDKNSRIADLGLTLLRVTRKMKCNFLKKKTVSEYLNMGVCKVGAQH
jgi:hypothetical protein